LAKERPDKDEAGKQHQRFVETAHQLECDEDQERFEKKLGKLAKQKISPQVAKKGRSE
jgi:hypothetical protein